MIRAAILVLVAGCAEGTVTAGASGEMGSSCEAPWTICGGVCVAPCGENQIIDWSTCACTCLPGFEWSGAACDASEGGDADGDADSDADGDADTDTDTGSDTSTETESASEELDEWPLYCEACAGNGDCGGGTNFCLSIVGGDGALFCGVECADVTDCPADASCIEVHDGDGALLGKNCAPRDGSC